MGLEAIVFNCICSSCIWALVRRQATSIFQHCTSTYIHTRKAGTVFPVLCSASRLWVNSACPRIHGWYLPQCTPRYTDWDQRQWWLSIYNFPFFVCLFVCLSVCLFVRSFVSSDGSTIWLSDYAATVAVKSHDHPMICNVLLSAWTYQVHDYKRILVFVLQSGMFL